MECDLCKVIVSHHDQHGITYRANAATGESITEAITRALEERLQRLNAARSFTQYLTPIKRVQQRIRERPVLDTRTADGIIGYGDDGTPT